jgi:hypothetical protein
MTQNLDVLIVVRCTLWKVITVSIFKENYVTLSGKILYCTNFQNRRGFIFTCVQYLWIVTKTRCDKDHVLQLKKRKVS